MARPAPRLRSPLLLLFSLLHTTCVQATERPIWGVLTQPNLANSQAGDPAYSTINADCTYSRWFVRVGVVGMGACLRRRVHACMPPSPNHPPTHPPSIIT